MNKKLRSKIQLLMSNPSSGLIKNILLVTGGTAIGQIINSLSIPIITRIYPPDEYGLLSVFSSLLLIFSFSSFKYELAIPIARDKDKADMLFILSSGVLTVFSILITIVLFIFGDSALMYVGAEVLEPFKVFIPIGIFFNGLNNILKQTMFRERNFKLLSTVNVQQNIIGNILKVILGMLNFGPPGLLLGRITSTSAGSFKLYKNTIFSYKRIKRYSFRQYWLTMKEYKDFPIYQSTSTLLIHVRNQMPILVFASFFGPSVVGLFGLANSIVKLPMTLVGQSVMDVFYAEIAAIGMENPTKIKKIANSLFKQLVFVGTIPTLILMFFGPILFSIVFGNDWSEAGVYAQMLSISIFANLVFSPISKVFEVYRRQNEKFFIDLISLGLVGSVFIVGSYFNLTARTTILLYSIIMTFTYFITFILSRRVINMEIRKRPMES